MLSPGTFPGTAQGRNAQRLPSIHIWLLLALKSKRFYQHGHVLEQRFLCQRTGGLQGSRKGAEVAQRALDKERCWRKGRFKDRGLGILCGLGRLWSGQSGELGAVGRDGVQHRLRDFRGRWRPPG